MVSLEKTGVCQTNVPDLGVSMWWIIGFWAQVLFYAGCKYYMILYGKFDLSTYGWSISTKKDGKILVASSLPSAISSEFNLCYSSKFHQKTIKNQGNLFVCFSTVNGLTLTSGLYVLLLVCLFQQKCRVKLRCQLPLRCRVPLRKALWLGNIS